MKAEGSLINENITIESPFGSKTMKVCSLHIWVKFLELEEKLLKKWKHI